MRERERERECVCVCMCVCVCVCVCMYVCICVCLACICLCHDPLTSLAVETQYYTGAWQCMRTVARDEGIRGFYCGIRPTILGMTPDAGVSLAGIFLQLISSSTDKAISPVLPLRHFVSLSWLDLLPQRLAVSPVDTFFLSYPFMHKLAHLHHVFTLVGGSILHAQVAKSLFNAI